MYYKVIKNGKVIDVLDHLTFVKYQQKHDVMLACAENEAEAIISSDGNYIWHVATLYKAPSCYETVTLEEIDSIEYNQLKLMNCKTPEEIIDAYTLQLIKEGKL